MAIDISRAHFRPSWLKRGKELGMPPDIEPAQAESDVVSSQNGHAERGKDGPEFDPIMNAVVEILGAVATRDHDKADFLSDEALLCLTYFEQSSGGQEQ